MVSLLLLDIMLQASCQPSLSMKKNLLEGDRMAILIFLRSTGFGEKYTQPVINPSTGKIDILSTQLRKSDSTLSGAIATISILQQLGKIQ